MNTINITSLVLSLYLSLGLIQGFLLLGTLRLYPHVHDQRPLDNHLENEQRQKDWRCQNCQGFFHRTRLIYVLNDLKVAIWKFFPQNLIMLSHFVNQPQFDCLLANQLVWNVLRNTGLYRD